MANDKLTEAQEYFSQKPEAKKIIRTSDNNWFWLEDRGKAFMHIHKNGLTHEYITRDQAFPKAEVVEETEAEVVEETTAEVVEETTAEVVKSPKHKK